MLRLLLLIVLVYSSLLIIKKPLAAETELSTANFSAVALKAKYTELYEQLLNNQFQRELHLISKDSSNDLKGEIYAVVDYPFGSVSTAC